MCQESVVRSPRRSSRSYRRFFSPTGLLAREGRPEVGAALGRNLQVAEVVPECPELASGFLIAELGTVPELIDRKLGLARDVTVGEVGLLLQVAAWRQEVEDKDDEED